MTITGTFIKLDRSIVNWRWYKRGNTARVFIHLIIKASTVDRDLEGIRILRGQIAITVPTLCEELGMSVKEIRTSLKHLRSTGEITCEKVKNFTVITLVNYSLYQDSVYQKKESEGQAKGRQGADEGQAKGRQRADEGQQYNNINNINNYNNINKCAREGADTFDVDEFFRIAVEHSKSKQKSQTENG